MPDKLRTYSSDEIDVTWSQRRCIHAKECVTHLSAVFDVDKHPWIQPKNAAADELAAVIQRCPTGALHYSRKDGGAAESTPEENTIRLVEDGPLYVKGQIQLTNGGSVSDDAAMTDTRMALCRCGMSDHKPFCDNNHIQTGFRDAAEINVSGHLVESEQGGSLVVNPTINGPLEIKGNMQIIDAKGDVISQDSTAYLCRCGGSSNKPFCDGTHNRIGFTANS